MNWRAPLCFLALAIAACENDTLDMVDANSNPHPDAARGADAANRPDGAIDRDGGTGEDAASPDGSTCMGMVENETLDVTGANETSHVFSGAEIVATGDGTFLVLGPNGEMISGVVPTTV